MAIFPQLLIGMYFYISLCNCSYNNYDHRPVFGYATNTEIKNCKYTKIEGMSAINCKDLKLTDLPFNRRTNVEVLDMTRNRIKKISNGSFIKYPNLKILNLTDNSITHIDEAAFDPLTKLEVLDLTLNNLYSVPVAIEKLPALRNLMLAKNRLDNVVFTNTLPSFPFLSLNSSLDKMPASFNALPNLQQLNMSDNGIEFVDIRQIAPMCRLELLDLRGNPRLFQTDPCGCQVFVSWIQRRSIKIYPDTFSICGGTILPDPRVCFTNDETLLIFEESEMISRSCDAVLFEYRSGPSGLKGWVVWVSAAVCLFVVLLIGYLGFLWRKKNRGTV